MRAMWAVAAWGETVIHKAAAGVLAAQDGERWGQDRK